MNHLNKWAMMVIFAALATPIGADHASNHDIGIESHRIDYGYAARLAYQLADLAEALTYGALANAEYKLDESIKDHREVRYRAEALHQAASNLYYLLQNNRGFGILDHREDSVRNAFYSVSNAYRNLNAVAYGYQMQRISNVYYNLSYAINGY